MIQRNRIAAVSLVALGLVVAAPPNAAHAQGNPPVLNGEQRNRQAPLPPEVVPKAPVFAKTYAKSAQAARAAEAATGFDLTLRQVNVPTAAWSSLIRSSGLNGEKIAARIAAASPQTDLYWAGYVKSGASVIVNTVIAQPVAAAQTMNSGVSYTLAPGADRTGLLIVKLSDATTTLTAAAPGTLPRQDQERHAYPVSLHNGVAKALPQTTPVDASHVDVVILTATIDNR